MTDEIINKGSTAGDSFKITAPLTVCNLIPDKTLFGFNKISNNFGFCDYFDDDNDDDECNPYNPLRGTTSELSKSVPADESVSGLLDIYNWNEIFNISSNYLNQQQEENIAPDYFNVFQE
jgi:hypothetical protein